jgi:hypothetical protein
MTEAVEGLLACAAHDVSGFRLAPSVLHQDDSHQPETAL